MGYPKRDQNNKRQCQISAIRHTNSGLGNIPKLDFQAKNCLHNYVLN